ncbi:hypothetical protein [Rhizobium mongolense]|uniref:Uncharacterized protein n=2 Tax=Rhizobium mongolense TaxID=57676 RepID=A0ABR6IVH0_9HYPH|nr:hypothetical protein [Rhizobium mongolense]MBB4231543.1 hypothetical protein [Rhizobium mongolense]TVZ64126.1 hypothetical protein BCL32_4333 [Rhizobium mongolense USDA 1844]
METFDPAYQLSDLYYELQDLHQLTETVREILCEMDYVRQDGSRNTDLVRVAAMNRFISDTVGRMADFTSRYDKPANN